MPVVFSFYLLFWVCCFFCKLFTFLSFWTLFFRLFGDLLLWQQRQRSKQESAAPRSLALINSDEGSRKFFGGASNSRVSCESIAPLPGRADAPSRLIITQNYIPVILPLGRENFRQATGGEKQGNSAYGLGSRLNTSCSAFDFSLLSLPKTVSTEGQKPMDGLLSAAKPGRRICTTRWGH